LTGALGAVTGGLTGALGAVTGGLTGALPNALGGLTGALPNALGGLTGAVNNVVGSAASILNITSGATAGLSTGLNALPGGAAVTASFVNNAVGAINSIPGVGAVAGLIGTASSAVANLSSGLSSLANPLDPSKALNTLTAAGGALTKGLDDLKSGKLSLETLASAGLPVGAAAELNAAICAMSSGGAVPVILPTMAGNTCDRGEVDAGLTAAFGSLKIPLPNFGGNPATLGKTASTVALDKANETRLKELDEKLAQQKKLADDAIAAQQTAKNSLPAGDPSIEELRQKAMVEVDKQIAIQNTIVATLRA
jgi:hypothetical protein